MRTKIYSFYRWVMSGPFDVGVSLTMLIMAATILLQPYAGVAGYIQHTYGDVMIPFALIVIVAAIEMVISPGSLRFALCSIPIALYAGMTFLYWFETLRAGVGIVTLTPVVFTFSFYVAVNWINDKRSQFETRRMSDTHRHLDKGHPSDYHV